ncbi:MAG TPA: hypothetical protein VND94_08265 [Terriglobia bacterium]|nr:hypothetical protein [Terriglobia bacterium]
MQTTNRQISPSRAILQAVVLIASSLAILWFALVEVGIAPTIHASRPDPGDPALLRIAAEHVLIGFVLFFGVLLSGIALAGLLPKGWNLSLTDLAMLGLPVGAVYWLLVVIMVRALGRDNWMSLVIGLLPAVGRCMWLRGILISPGTASRASSWSSVAAVVVLTATASAMMGSMWRYPNALTSGTVALGDIGQYIASYHELRTHLWPIPSLRVEGEHVYLYFNLLAPLLAFAFDRLPGFEISFFFTSSVAVFCILGTCWSCHQILTYRRARSPVQPGPLTLVATILLLCAATRYPSWFAESPPYAFAMPMALALVYFADRGRDVPFWRYALIPLTIVVFAVTKVVPLAVFGTYVAVLLLAGIAEAKSPRYAPLIITGIAVLGLLCGALLFYYAPKFIAISDLSNFGPQSLQILYRKIAINGSGVFKSIIRTLPALAIDIGGLLLVIGAFCRRNIALGAAVLMGLSLYYLYTFLFNGTLAIAAALCGGYLLLNNRDDEARRSTGFFIAGAALILISHLCRDPGGWEFVALWLIALSASLALIFWQGESRAVAGAPAQALAQKWRYALPVAVLCLLVAQADGHLRLGDDQRTAVSPKLYDLWVKVRDITPADALIFTDQTGDDPTRLEGWNDFSTTAERQFYISSWATSALRANHAAREERLSLNAAVLAGTKRPSDLDLTSQYSDYFAAVAANHPMPGDATQIYSNGDYAIYRLAK